MIKFDKLQGIKALKQPPKAKNPSVISQKGKQSKPVTLAKAGRGRDKGEGGSK